MRNHQKGADITEFVGPLIKRLKLAKERVPENSQMEKIIDQISTEVVKARDLLNNREKLDRELVGYFAKIERQMDSWIDHKPRETASDLPQKTTITEEGESSSTSYQMDEDSKFKEFMGSLDALKIICLSSLGIIPENTELKKRLMMYFWLALFWPYYCEAKDLERVFSDLVDKNVLIPVHRDHNKVIDRFTIEPIFHKWLHGILSKHEGYGLVSYEKRKEGIWGLYTDISLYKDQTIHKLLINIDQRYLNSKDIMDISREHFHLHVVQLGSWHHTETKIHNGVEKTVYEETKSKYHIEVDQTDFLKKLGGEVRYLSLRGISGIVELPESIGKLPFLYILDLRACHNLDKLPQKPRSTLKQKIVRCASPKDNAWFEKLVVLDISECYLLDHMPKWLCELSKLEVLKGFVVGGLGNKNNSCRLGDLSKLNKLSKLSIRIAIDILGPDIFQGFNTLDNILVLTITWGVNKYKEVPSYSLPKNLEKLDIRCYPEADASKLQNPEELKNLKRLYIRGGNLTKIPCNDNWKVEILRLRFLKKLVYPTDWNDLGSSFKNLRYVEYVECPKPKNFPNDWSSWHNEG